jgi:hypothetical protein
MVHATLVIDPQEDQEAAGHAEGEPEDIDEGEGFVIAERPPGDGKIVLEHGLWFLTLF